MKDKDGDIDVVRMQDLGGLAAQSAGLGIFINCGDYRMNVGAIFPLPDGRYQLNIMIIPDMQVATHNCCDFSESYNNADEAIAGARAFLASNRK